MSNPAPYRQRPKYLHTGRCIHACLHFIPLCSYRRNTILRAGSRTRRGGNTVGRELLLVAGRARGWTMTAGAIWVASGRWWFPTVTGCRYLEARILYYSICTSIRATESSGHGCARGRTVMPRRPVRTAQPSAITVYRCMSEYRRPTHSNHQSFIIVVLLFLWLCAMQ